jgi:hypothetical protein
MVYEHNPWWGLEYFTLVRKFAVMGARSLGIFDTLEEAKAARDERIRRQQERRVAA